MKTIIGISIAFAALFGSSAFSGPKCDELRTFLKDNEAQITAAMANVPPPDSKEAAHHSAFVSYVGQSKRPLLNTDNLCIRLMQQVKEGLARFNK